VKVSAMKLICRTCRWELKLAPEDAQKAGKRCGGCGKSTVEMIPDGAQPQSPNSQPVAQNLRATTTATTTHQPDDSVWAVLLRHVQNPPDLAVTLRIVSGHKLPADTIVRLRTPEGQASEDCNLNQIMDLQTNQWTSDPITLQIRRLQGPQILAFSVRVLPKNALRFLEGRLLIEEQRDGTLNITVDNSQHGQDVVGGLNEYNFNFAPRQQVDEILRIPLAETTQLRPRHRDDLTAPDHLAMLDRKTHLGEPLTATERPLRLTLRQHSSNESLDRHILLVAGKTLRMGRANTWSSQHLSHPPNDLVLRVPETSEKVVNYISNTHLMIARRENSLYLHDYSKHGTLIDNRQIHQASLDLTANKGHLKPGTSGADRPESSLRLNYQRVQNHDPEFISKLSEFAQFSGQPAPLNWCSDVLVFNRDDAPETCVFMLDVLRIGYDPAVCGWLLPKRNGNRPVQAVVFRLGDGLWITPGGPGCAVVIENQPIDFENIVRLKNNMHLSIDGHQFIAEPWRQHFVT
jgi:hypothetical protein